MKILDRINLYLNEKKFEVGDTVHLGHKQKGGAGIIGKIIKIEGDKVYIKHKDDKEYRGLMKNVSSAKTNESSNFIWKGPIFINNGKKIGVGASMSDDTLVPLNWNQYKKLNVSFKDGKYTSNLSISETLINALMDKLQFNRKVEFSRIKDNMQFEEQIEWLIKNGAKLPKNGIDYRK